MKHNKNVTKDKCYLLTALAVLARGDKYRPAGFRFDQFCTLCSWIDSFLAITGIFGRNVRNFVYLSRPGVTVIYCLGFKTSFKFHKATMMIGKTKVSVITDENLIVRRREWADVEVLHTRDKTLTRPHYFIFTVYTNVKGTLNRQKTLFCIPIEDDNY